MSILLMRLFIILALIFGAANILKQRFLPNTELQLEMLDSFDAVYYTDI